MGKPSASIYYDSRRPDDCRIRLRVNFTAGKGKWIQKYFTLEHKLTLLELAQVRSGKPTTRRCREIMGEASTVLAKANAIIKDNPGISPAGFEGVYLGRQVRSVGVASLFTECEYKFREMGRIASEDSYRASRGKLIEFGGEGLTLNVIDVDFLRRFAQWMKAQGYRVKSWTVAAKSCKLAANLLSNEAGKNLTPPNARQIFCSS